MTPHASDSALYRTLLESTRAIPWKIDWATATFSYIGPQIEDLLGWAPTSWRTVQDWAERMHPDDRERVVNFCITQSQCGVDHEADYRALTARGDYVWIRDVVHVVRDLQGGVVALVGFMFDITERKQNEEKLLQLQQELEDLSFRDGLTGVANRRKFDAVLAREWQDARRNARPLSLLMFDVDFFKRYNDQYGHVEGDECLRRVARALERAAHRPQDCLARYGGEEFVLLLPGSDAPAARAVAQRCMQEISGAGIAHAGSPLGEQLTVSVGIGTIIPGAHDEPMPFLDEVDRRLYRAKHGGRNRIEDAALA
ncbi:GGDEF domain-containing protein [Alicycliphilus denitrificans]|uniref:GGDEF domain-containing protein n=1 Tax=Alicycliphilus denitrificans TaxID=179636 RepID=UPI00384F5FC3